jgi:predicted XRE-type DNA-binding protein
MDVEKEIKLIGRRTEETLAIIVDHFKDTDERIEEIEDKIQEITDTNAHIKQLLIKQLLVAE